MRHTTLLAFGCSNTRGTEAVSDYDGGIDNTDVNMQYAYPKFLADILGFKYENHSVNGLCNQEIASKVFEVIDKRNTDIFVIIGWTDDNRISISKKPQKSILTITSDCCTINNSLVMAHVKHRLCQKLTPRERDNINYTRDISFETMIGISEHIFPTKNFFDINFFIKYATSLYLEKQEIPYLTLPTLYTPFDKKYNLLSSKYNITSYNSDGHLIFNMLNMFKQYGISTSGVHLRAEAHKQLAHFLYDHIKKYKLLDIC